MGFDVRLCGMAKKYRTKVPELVMEDLFRDVINPAFRRIELRFHGIRTTSVQRLEKSAIKITVSRSQEQEFEFEVRLLPRDGAVYVNMGMIGFYAKRHWITYYDPEATAEKMTIERMCEVFEEHYRSEESKLTEFLQSSG